jgi:hypothetical protein
MYTSHRQFAKTAAQPLPRPSEGRSTDGRMDYDTRFTFPSSPLHIVLNPVDIQKTVSRWAVVLFCLLGCKYLILALFFLCNIDVFFIYRVYLPFRSRKRRDRTHQRLGTASWAVPSAGNRRHELKVPLPGMRR